MIARAVTFWLAGLDARRIDVEAHLQRKAPSFVLVGLPDRAVQEARERVRSGIISSAFDFPSGGLVINLAPARERKQGSGFDLAMALSLLAVSGQVPPSRVEHAAAVAELGLDGRLRPVDGVLPMAEAAGRLGLDAIIVAVENGGEAAMAGGVPVIAADDLNEAVNVLSGRAQPREVQARRAGGSPLHPELADVHGQPRARRAIEIAATGGHNLLLCGPPGSGKTMLARRLPGLMPPLGAAESLEITRIHSAAGLLNGTLPDRPFRSPHHSASMAALVGGAALRPGEVSLATGGVLFLDELAEFTRPALEALRIPLEDGEVTIARAAGSVRMPARCLVVAAMNPCPCGRHGDPGRECVCPPQRVGAYRSKISGPLLDRFDLFCEVPRADAHGEPGETTTAVAARVQMADARLREAPPEMSKGSSELLAAAAEQRFLSARGTARAARVAATIAALAGTEQVDADQMAEALSYRMEAFR